MVGWNQLQLSVSRSVAYAQLRHTEQLHGNVGAKLGIAKTCFCLLL